MKKKLILLSVVLIILGASCNVNDNFGSNENSIGIDFTQVVVEETEIIEKSTATHVIMPTETALDLDYENWILISFKNSENNFRIAVVNPETFDLQILPIDSFEAGHGTWAPDYKSFAIDNFSGGIYIIPVECFAGEETCSNKMEKIVDGYGGLGTSLNWSPDGKYIAIRDSGISLIDIENKQVIKVTETGYYPAWSAHLPESIIYHSEFGIIIHNIASGAITSFLSRDDYTIAQGSVAFSPVEQKIALVIDVGNEFSDLDHRTDILILDVVTKEVVFVIQDASYPAWSSSGNQLAFIRNRDLFVYDIAENIEIQITEDLRIYNIDWSP